MIAINLSFRLMPTADVLYAADPPFWEYYGDEVATFKGERWTTARDVPGTNYIESIDTPGLSHVPTKIHTGGNSGYQALNLAVGWGVSRVVLLGYDMGATGGRLHFHPNHPEQLGNPINLDRWVERFAVAAADLRTMGVQVVNASRSTALHCFERMSLAAALG